MSFAFNFPYSFSPEFARPVAYFCMEYAVHQSLKIYAGGLGFLAGSHMKSAYELKQNTIGIGILWKYGYYDQVRKSDQSMGVLFQEKKYGYLRKTGIKFPITINAHEVMVEAWYLPPELFKTAPIFLLSTDTEENDYLARTICHHLYSSNPETSAAAAILLGAGGAKLLDLLNVTPDVYHLNEAHGLPLAFYLYKKYKDLTEVKKKLVFTVHNPEPPGSRVGDLIMLHNIGFFCGLAIEEVREIINAGHNYLDFTLSALRMSGIANGVSEAHCKILHQQWKDYMGLCPIVCITNAQSFTFWADDEMYKAVWNDNYEVFKNRKRKCKRRLFDEVADQNGEIYNPDILTIVFAKRFTGYKRPDLLIRDMKRFDKLVTNPERPIQIIWAGKPYPMDYNAIATFNKIVDVCKHYSNCSVLIGYELRLSKLLKRGADVWLNVPRLTQEASGTSGMSAAMCGAVNVSIPDGWYPEFVKNGENGFSIPSADPSLSIYEQDDADAASLFDLLENTVIPMYYNDPQRWYSITAHSMQDIMSDFDSDRMAAEYYRKIYAVVSGVMSKIS